jgi:hypothetical protein
MRIYLAGPMTGLPRHNVPAFDEAAAVLREMGLDVVSPPDITRANPLPGVHCDGSIEPEAYAALCRLDFAELLTCEAMVVLPGWARSGGFARELVVAEAICLPVYSLAEFLEHGALYSTPLSVRAIVTLAGRAVESDLPGQPYSVTDCAGGESFDGDPSRTVLGQAAL